MKKRVFLGCLLIVILFITSCGYKPAGGEKPLDTIAALKQVQTGTQGVQVKFVNNYPPTTLYDTTDLTILAEVWNKGAHDLKRGDCFVHLIGYDKNIIRNMQTFRACNSVGTLEGKKVYNLKGSSNQIEFSSKNIKLPYKVNEYSPNLNLVACYDYQTVANPLVCVENSLYQTSSQQKSCIVKDVRMSGQGAPVGVSYVDVEMAGGKAIFAITIKNYNSLGRIISPTASLSYCPNNLQYSDFDKVYYTVSLSGGSLINCKPRDNYVKMNNNEGKIICSFNIGNVQAYETPLMITLDYNYMQALRKPVKIIATPGYS
tara:strand:- start:2120 stop:3067 length:948 start_codon:yes stop_codon:yes gene_type:complete